MTIYNLALCMALLSTPICQAMLKIKLPDSEKLTHTFTTHGFQHLVEEIPGIINSMANEKKSPDEIKESVELALFFYQMRSSIHTSTKPLSGKKESLINALLENPSILINE